MIAKKSIFRKLSIISLAVLIFCSSLLGSSVNTAHALGWDTVIKLVGGKAVVRAIAEKAGMQLSKKQIDNVAGFIEKRTFDGDPKAIEFATKANSVTSSGSSLKEGFKKYLLDPGAWLLGLDLIMLAINAFEDGYNSGLPVETIAYCTPSPHPSLNNGKWVYYTTKTSGYKYYFTWSGTAEVKVMPTGSLDSIDGLVNTYSKLSTTNNGSTWNTINNQVVSNSSIRIESSTNAPITILSAYNDQSICNNVPVLEDLTDITNVSPVIINNFDNDTYNTNTTYVIEIEMPDVVNYDDPTPWNEPDPQIAEEIDPAPPDSDEDGTPDETDSDADSGGWLENLIPIITLIAIFDLLKAVIFYLARMFEFILTIPLIEAKPIDNVAFEWFRTAEIVGIEIYSLISLLATVGLSFAVYKVVRRLLP